MKEYLIISKDIGVVTGKEAIMLIDYKSSKQMIADKEKYHILQECIKGVEIKRLKEKYAIQLVEELITELVENNLAYISKNYFYRDDFRLGKYITMLNEKVTKLNRAFIEIPSDCSENCSFCSSLKSSSCWICNRFANKVDEINMDIYASIMQQLKLFKCNQVILHGGNLFEKMSLLEDILKKTRYVMQNNLDILLICNVLHIDDKALEVLHKYQVKPVIVFDCTDKAPKPYQEQFEFVEKVYSKYYTNQPMIVSLLVNDCEEGSLTGILNYFFDHNCINLNTSYIIDTKAEKEISPSELKKIYHIPTSRETSYYMKNFNCCLNGMIAITADLKVLPCPEMRNQVIYELNKNNINLMKAFDGYDENLTKYWLLSIDSIDPCNGCVNRYTCQICTNLESNITGDYKVRRDCSLYNSAILQ